MMSCKCLTLFPCYAVIIFIVLLIFMFVTYTTSSKIGNIGVMYNNLTEVARLNPVAGNRGGSYLTFWSIAGLKFGVLQTVSCWGKLHSKDTKRKGKNRRNLTIFQFGVSFMRSQVLYRASQYT